MRVVILEGDGRALMSLGTLPLIAVERPANLVHIILDHKTYESTGVQPSINARVDLAQVGPSCRYKSALRVPDIAARCAKMTELGRGRCGAYRMGTPEAARMSASLSGAMAKLKCCCKASTTALAINP